MTLGLSLNNELALTGSLVHLFNHALMKGALFMAVAGVVLTYKGTRIHDFAGPYYIGIDDFMVGCVLRYAVIPSDKDDQAWDESIARADEEYRKRMHNICCDNWCARAFMLFFRSYLTVVICITISNT